MKKNKIVQVIFMLLILTQMVFGQTMSTAVGSEDRLRLTAKDTIEYLNIPERLENAVGGSEFAHQIAGLSIKDREKAIVREILSGNVPSFSRKLKPLKITKAINGKSYE